MLSEFSHLPEHSLFKAVKTRLLSPPTPLCHWTTSCLGHPWSLQLLGPGVSDLSLSHLTYQQHLT